jgi:hypothetical protein
MIEIQTVTTLSFILIKRGNLLSRYFIREINKYITQVNRISIFKYHRKQV